jgi:hypothetical protein
VCFGAADFAHVRHFSTSHTFIMAAASSFSAGAIDSNSASTLSSHEMSALAAVDKMSVEELSRFFGKAKEQFSLKRF